MTAPKTKWMCPYCKVILKSYDGEPWCPKCYRIMWSPVALAVDDLGRRILEDLKPYKPPEGEK